MLGCPDQEDEGPRIYASYVGLPYHIVLGVSSDARCDYGARGRECDSRLRLMTGEGVCNLRTYAKEEMV